MWWKTEIKRLIIVSTLQHCARSFLRLILVIFNMYFHELLIVPELADVCRISQSLRPSWTFRHQLFLTGANCCVCSVCLISSFSFASRKYASMEALNTQLNTFLIKILSHFSNRSMWAKNTINSGHYYPPVSVNGRACTSLAPIIFPVWKCL